MVGKSKESSAKRTVRLREGRRLLAEKVKLEKAQLSSKKYEQKLKDKSSKKWQKLAKKLSKPKQILKKERASLTIPDYKAPSVLGDPNRFFKSEMEETKKSMFFE